METKTQINRQLFQEEYGKILTKLQEINKIPQLYGTGQNFMGITLDGDTINYHTQSWFQGCETEDFTLSVDLTDINKPIEFFQEKFQQQFLEKQEKDRVESEKQNKLIEENERKQLAKLQDKYKTAPTHNILSEEEFEERDTFM